MNITTNYRFIPPNLSFSQDYDQFYFTVDIGTGSPDENVPITVFAIDAFGECLNGSFIENNDITANITINNGVIPMDLTEPSSIGIARNITGKASDDVVVSSLRSADYDRETLVLKITGGVVLQPTENVYVGRITRMYGTGGLLRVKAAGLLIFPTVSTSDNTNTLYEIDVKVEEA